jgi:hypothetical protein
MYKQSMGGKSVQVCTSRKAGGGLLPMLHALSRSVCEYVHQDTEALCQPSERPQRILRRMISRSKPT